MRSRFVGFRRTPLEWGFGFALFATILGAAVFLSVLFGTQAASNGPTTFLGMLYTLLLLLVLVVGTYQGSRFAKLLLPDKFTPAGFRLTGTFRRWDAVKRLYLNPRLTYSVILLKGPPTKWDERWYIIAKKRLVPSAEQFANLVASVGVPLEREEEMTDEQLEQP